MPVADITAALSHHVTADGYKMLKSYNLALLCIFNIDGILVDSSLYTGKREQN